MKQFDSNNKAFQVPENYFEQLEDSILTQNKFFSEGNRFDVPSNYFNELDQSILQRTVNSKSSNVRKLWIGISSVAACAILALVAYNSSKEVNTFVDQQLTVFHLKEVDNQTEEAVYKSLYQFYFVEEEQKKSSNELTLDDFEEYYNEELSSVY